MVCNILRLSKKPKTPKEGVDYKLVNIESSDLTAVEILHGSFSGVIYHYNHAKVEIDPTDMARLVFSYQFIYTANFSDDYLKENEEFVTLMGDILSGMIIKEEVYGQTGTINSEESDFQ